MSRRNGRREKIEIKIKILRFDIKNNVDWTVHDEWSGVKRAKNVVSIFYNRPVPLLKNNCLLNSYR